MENAAATADKAISKAKGRKDETGQEGVIKLKPVEDSIEDLMELKTKADLADVAFNDAVKAVAEKSQLLASVVRKFVNARMGEKFQDEKRKCEQLMLCFDEIGLVKGAK